MTGISAGGLSACFFGSVNRWECDENDHQNVRFYAHKINQALQIRLGELLAEPVDLPRRLIAQHIRFLREVRAATPLRVECGLVTQTREQLEMLCVMHHNLSDEPVAAFLCTVDSRGWRLPEGINRVVDVPEYALPRGIDTAPPALPDSLEAAREQGFQRVGRGLIGAAECDAGGLLLPELYIGRISDAMPNLWAFLSGTGEQAARDSGDLGGAALEQRLTIHQPLRAGSVFTQMSGVRSLGSKTQQMAHLLFDEATGRVAASAEAVGVAMDLRTRKAVPISDERRARLTPLLLRQR